VLRGQSETMYKSYVGLLVGLIFSILLVYLLIVVNFQSWLDPFIIISALPAALAGIVWFLFLTNTRLSVPALTGAIMCMGVATANSILVVSFAREQLDVLVGDARRAALNAGFVRLRPVLMTALAMIIGMVPMSLAWETAASRMRPSAAPSSAACCWPPLPRCSLFPPSSASCTAALRAGVKQRASCERRHL